MLDAVKRRRTVPKVHAKVMAYHAKEFHPWMHREQQQQEYSLLRTAVADNPDLGPAGGGRVRRRVHAPDPPLS